MKHVHLKTNDIVHIMWKPDNHLVFGTAVCGVRYTYKLYTTPSGAMERFATPHPGPSNCIACIGTW